jgi:hemoglobin
MLEKPMKAPWILLIVAGLAFTGGCGGAPPKEGGGHDREFRSRDDGYEDVQAIVKDFVENVVAKDPRLSARFAKADVPHLERALSEQLGEACGCPGVKYSGKTMKSAHQGMGIATGEFNAFVEDFEKTLDHHGCAPADRATLLKTLEASKDDIVERP